MQRISITNPQNIIDGTAKKYYFKLRNTGGPKGDKGDKGDTGATGPQGPQGNAATVSVGSTTTLPVGQDATVENVGTQYNAVLNFGIPQGPRGPQGIQGERGEPGQTGQTGPRGPQGERGTNATVYVGTTTTTNPGTQARVYNSGTDSNAVLNFEIPRGDVGPQPELVQTTGSSTTKAMSQNATTVALNGKQNTLTAGSNIQISSNTISATDTTYTAGNGLTLTGTEFSADTTVLATQTDIAPKLETEVVAELPTTGEQDKLYLTPKNYTTGTATGNPITISIGEDAGQISSAQLDGDTTQQTYTGQNLYDVSTLQVGSAVTVDDDGWITVTKDNSAGSSSSYTNIWTNNLALETSTQYAIFLEVKEASGTGELDITSTNSTQGQFSSWEGKQIASLVAGQVFKFAPTTKSSFSGIYGGLRTILNLQAGQSASVTFRLSVLADTSIAPSGFVYEPYVGGTPSPNPDYPQPIQTVTGRQVVNVTGKNRLRQIDGTYSRNGITATVNNGKITLNGTATATAYIPLSESSDYYSLDLSGVYTLSATRITGVSYTIYQGGASVLYSTSSSQTKTLGGTYENVRFQINVAQGTTLNNVVVEAQLEAGSTATDYAPYSKQTYPLDLGSIELCKLGTYQDYIWKDGENWKVHKDTGKYTFAGTESWTWDNSIPRLFYGSGVLANLGVYSSMPTSTSTLPTAACNKFTGKTFNDFYTNQQSNGFAMSTLGKNWNFGDKSWTSSEDAVADVTGTTVYYALLSAYKTDTVITDQTLIAQLEAIRTASLQNGANTITNTATGTNLAGDMEIGYYGYNPRNRYDKWLWLDINNEYEQLNNPDTSSTLSTLSTRSLGATTEQPTVTRSLETETITLKKGETDPIEDKTELPTILDEEAEETETTEPEESDGTDER